MNSSSLAWQQAVHPYDSTWYPQDWLLPVIGNKLYQLNPYNMEVGNLELDGLFVCCCPLAVYTLGLHFGKKIAPEGTEFLLQNGKHIAQFVEDVEEADRLRTFYFLLCDPKRPLHLLFLPLPIVQAVTVLRRQTPLSQFFHLTQEYT